MDKEKQKNGGKITNLEMFEVIFEDYLTDEWYNRTPLEKERYIESFIRQALVSCEKAVEEKVREEIKKLHKNSESRTVGLECSQDGYEYGLEDVLQALNKKEI